MHHEDPNKVIDEFRQGEALTLISLPRSAQALRESELAGGRTKRFFLESYGCAMNFSDSEIVASILVGKGYSTTTDFHEADIILLNTCAIRDNAEQRVRGRLKEYNIAKRKNPKLMIGILGCMAERLKSKLLEEEKIVDIVVGPDAYRDLPNLIESVEGGQKAVNVLLSLEETYADISPVRLGGNGVTAFISITRGCDNMCSFCVVPFTRGRERSRDPESIVHEAKNLFEQGYREVTLLGQNVDSYKWHPEHAAKKEINKALPTPTLKGENNSHASLRGMGVSDIVSFAHLLEMVALVSPDLRVRFSTSNPQDMTDDVLHIIAKHENICNYVHLPVQSGNTEMLARMNRGYSREKYLERIAAINRIIPDCGISTDIITGFCGETEKEHMDTLSLMNEVKFDFAYMFAYSERPGTLAEKKYKDDIPEELKKSRLQEVIALQQQHSSERTKQGIGKVHRVLVEGISKKSKDRVYGRNSQNTVVVFTPPLKGEGIDTPLQGLGAWKGQYVNVLAEECTLATLIGEVIS
ncbi:MAG: tRNA (N6-isopentenyl adenosine(37)-C2)-methylthiotransferase MiaB [Bacteroidetes bacterium]|nr:MAG: tRNA (N6-isopentenyl adenosine(37)-C2)-methylthiotransferase MiaB [Bacteroidota bacterium]